MPTLVGRGDDGRRARLADLVRKLLHTPGVHRAALEAHDHDLAHPLVGEFGRGREVLVEELVGERFG